MKNSFQILYVFGHGRKNKIVNKSYEAKDFFYGYLYLKEKYSIEIVEPKTDSLNTNFVNFLCNKVLTIYDKIIIKLTSFPSYSNQIISKLNLKKYFKSDVIVFTSDALYISFLPIILCSKLFLRNKKVFVITMGLFGKQTESNLKKALNFYFFKILLAMSDKFIFLGYGEYQYSLQKYKKYINKFFFLPFNIDTEFWSSDKKFARDGVLFVGNDGKRDFKFLEELASKMKNVKFTFITSHEFSTNLNNVDYKKGNWSENLISDTELKEYYLSAKLVIIPLKNSFQPSGQSVGLQAISTNTPLLITKTKGFWGDTKFLNSSKVNFVDVNNLNLWEEKINLIINKFENFQLEDDKLKEFNKNYNIDVFNMILEEQLKEIC